MTTLKAFLEKKRMDHGLSQVLIGKCLGIDQTTVSLYEKSEARLVKNGANFVERFFNAYKFDDIEKNIWFRRLFQEVLPYLEVEPKQASLERIHALMDELSQEIKTFRGLI